MSQPRRPFRRRVLLNTLVTGAGNVWAMVVTLLSLPLLLHGLGSAAFGTWVLLQTFSAVTGWFSLADLGVATSTTRVVAERRSVGDEDGVARAIASAMALFVLLALFWAALLALLGPAFLPALFRTPARLRSALRLAIVLFAGQTVLDLVTEGVESCAEGLQRVDSSRAIDAVRRTLVAVATIVAAQRGGGLKGVAAASLVSSAVGTAVGVLVLRRLAPHGGAASRAEMRSLLGAGKAVAVLRPIGVIQRTMDRTIVGAVLGPEAVTLVEIATQVLNGANAVLSATSYVVVPAAPWLQARGDRDTLRELMETGTKYSLLATLPFVASAMILARPMIRLWLGSGYGAGPGLVVLALSYIALVSPLQVGSNLLVGVGKAGEVLRAAGAALVVNLIGSIVLVHVVGIAGTFQGTLLGTAVLVPPLARSALREVGSTPGEFVRRSLTPVLPPVLALAVVTGGVVALGLGDAATLVLGGLAGGAAYAAVAASISMRSGELAGLRDTLRG